MAQGYDRQQQVQLQQTNVPDVQKTLSGQANALGSAVLPYSNPNDDIISSLTKFGDYQFKQALSKKAELDAADGVLAYASGKKAEELGFNPVALQAYKAIDIQSRFNDFYIEKRKRIETDDYKKTPDEYRRELNEELKKVQEGVTDPDQRLLLAGMVGKGLTNLVQEHVEKHRTHSTQVGVNTAATLLISEAEAGISPLENIISNLDTLFPDLPQEERKKAELLALQGTLTTGNLSLYNAYGGYQGLLTRGFDTDDVLKVRKFIKLSQEKEEENNGIEDLKVLKFIKDGIADGTIPDLETAEQIIIDRVSLRSQKGIYKQAQESFETKPTDDKLEIEKSLSLGRQAVDAGNLNLDTLDEYIVSNFPIGKSRAKAYKEFSTRILNAQNKLKSKDTLFVSVREKDYKDMLDSNELPNDEDRIAWIQTNIPLDRQEEVYRLGNRYLENIKKDQLKAQEKLSAFEEKQRKELIALEKSEQTKKLKSDLDLFKVNGENQESIVKIKEEVARTGTISDDTRDFIDALDVPQNVKTYIYQSLNKVQEQARLGGLIYTAQKEVSNQIIQKDALAKVKNSAGRVLRNGSSAWFDGTIPKKDQEKVLNELINSVQENVYTESQLSDTEKGIKVAELIAKPIIEAPVISPQIQQKFRNMSSKDAVIDGKIQEDDLSAYTLFEVFSNQGMSDVTLRKYAGEHYDYLALAYEAKISGADPEKALSDAAIALTAIKENRINPNINTVIPKFNPETEEKILDNVINTGNIYGTFFGNMLGLGENFTKIFQSDRERILKSGQIQSEYAKSVRKYGKLYPEASGFHLDKLAKRDLKKFTYIGGNLLKPTKEGKTVKELIGLPDGDQGDYTPNNAVLTFLSEPEIQDQLFRHIKPEGQIELFVKQLVDFDGNVPTQTKTISDKKDATTVDTILLSLGTEETKREYSGVLPFKLDVTKDNQFRFTFYRDNAKTEPFDADPIFVNPKEIGNIFKRRITSKIRENKLYR